MKAILIGTICGCMLVLTAFTALFLDGLTRTAQQLPTTVDLAVAREAQLTRTFLDIKIDTVAGKLDKQVTGLRTDLFARVDKIEGDANLQLINLQANAVTQIADTRTALVKEVQDTRTPLLALLPPIQNTLDKVSYTSDLMLDCENNVDCFANRSQGTLKAVEKMAAAGEVTMKVIAETAPVFTGNVNGVTADFHDATHSLDQKYFHPPPRNRKQKVFGFFSNFEALLIAALRGGAI